MDPLLQREKQKKIPSPSLSNTPDPEPSQPSPLSTEMVPEPTADGEPVPAVMKVPAERTEPTIAPEPNPTYCLTGCVSRLHLALLLD